jgi:type IV pilus assembly protein PilF
VKRIRAGVFCVALCLSACGGNSDVKSANLAEAARINTQLGIDYMRKGEMDLAEEKLKRAIEDDPGMAQAHSTLAYVYSRRGDSVLAEKEYRKALSLDSENPSARNNFGVFLCGQGKLDEAEGYFLGAAKDPHYTTPEAAWTNAGVCLRKADMDKAERYFRAALEINHDFPDALANMAWISCKKKDWWRASAFLQRYEQVGAATPESLWVGAQTTSNLGDKAAANKYIKRLKTEFPESDEAGQVSKQ